MRLRARVLSVGAAAAATAGLLVPAAAARAAFGQITVTSAGSPAGGVGELSIGLEATSTVDPASIKASMYAAGGATPALTVTGFAQTGGLATGAGATTWTVAAPIPAGSGPGELPLGSYRIEVTAADQAGDTTDDSDAGTLAYLIQPAVTLSVSPAIYSYGQQVTISGTDIGLYPDGSHAPVAGQEIDINGSGALAATTAAEGSFQLTAQAGTGQAGDALAFGVLGDAVANGTTAQAFSNSVPTTIVPDPVRITETQSPAVVNSGGTETVSGTVTFDTGSGWLPLTGAELSLTVLGTGRPPFFLTTTTDPAGDYAFSFPADVPRQYQVSFSSTYWMSGSAVRFAVAPLDVPVTDQISARMTGGGDVTVAACVAISLANGGSVYKPAAAPLPALHVQYAPAATGPWRTLLTAAPDSAGCNAATVQAPGASGFYRTVTAADRAYQAGTSTAVRATPAAKSAITAFTAGPRRLTAGRRVKVTGRLTGTGTKPGQTVELYFRRSGSKRWRALGRVKVTARRTFSESARLYHSGDIEVRYGGAAFTRPCRRRIVYIRVTR